MGNNSIPFILDDGTQQTLPEVLGNTSNWKLPAYNNNYISPLNDTIFPKQTTVEFKDDFYKEEIDFDKLAKDLKAGLPFTNLDFKYTDYISTKTVEVEEYLNRFGPPTKILEKVSNPLVYKTKNQAYFLGSKLNKLNHNLSGEMMISVSFKDARVHYSISFPYYGTEDFRTNATSTESTTDFNIDDKFDAIIIKTDNIKDAFAFINAVKPKADVATSEKYVTSRFNDFFKKYNGIAAKLKPLYEQAPDFVLNTRDKEQLWKDLLLLIEYDDKGTFSFVKDASNAVVNILNGINDLSFLYDKFSKDPALIKRIYEDLNGESEYEGEIKSNKIIFTSILSTICWSNFDKVTFSGAYFRIGKNDSEVEYIVDSNLRESKDKIPNQILLQQAYKGPYDGRTFYLHDYKEYYDPMEMVTIITYDDEYNEIPLLVCAMYIKAIADQNEWKQIFTYIRIGLDIVLVAASLITLVTGPQFLLFTISLIDLGLASGDLIVMANESELMKTKEGKQFLETWNKIYMVGGIVTAGPLLLRTALNIGAKLLETLTIANARNFVVSLMIRALAQRNITFGKYVIEFIENADKVFKITNYTFPLSMLKKMYNSKALFIKGTNAEGKIEELFVYYRSEIIAKGTPKEIREIMKDVAKATGENIIKELDKIWARIPKLDDTGKYWMCTNKAGTELRWLNQKGINGTLRNEKSIQKYIQQLKNNTDTSEQWVGEVVEEFKKIDELTDVNNKRLEIRSGKKPIEAGDIDVGTLKYLVECKESLTHNTLTTKMKSADKYEIIEQFDKYLNPKNVNFINPKNKKVILAVKELEEGVDLNHFIFKRLFEIAKNNKIELEIITNINQIKKLK